MTDETVKLDKEEAMAAEALLDGEPAKVDETDDEPSDSKKLDLIGAMVTLLHEENRAFASNDQTIYDAVLVLHKEAHDNTADLDLIKQQYGNIASVIEEMVGLQRVMIDQIAEARGEIDAHTKLVNEAISEMECDDDEDDDYESASAVAARAFGFALRCLGVGVMVVLIALSIAIVFPAGV